MRRDHMQFVAWVLQHLLFAATVETVQIGREIGTHLGRGGPALAGLQFIVLVNVSVFQGLQFFHRMRQTGRGHAPSANRRAYQVNGLGTGGQPLAKQKTVQGPQQQALGATCGPGNDGNVLGLQTLGLQMLHSLGSGVDGQGFHAHGPHIRAGPNSALLGRFLASSRGLWQLGQPLGVRCFTGHRQIQLNDAHCLLPKTAAHAGSHFVGQLGLALQNHDFQ